jgi:hypothetical protein
MTSDIQRYDHRAMRFLENTDLLKIEDILPFFPDFVVIDDFKEEIAHALEGYSAHIDMLKHEMDEATCTAESIKTEILSLRNRSRRTMCSVCASTVDKTILCVSVRAYFSCRLSYWIGKLTFSSERAI